MVIFGKPQLFYLLQGKKTIKNKCFFLLSKDLLNIDHVQSRHCHDISWNKSKNNSLGVISPPFGLCLKSSMSAIECLRVRSISAEQHKNTNLVQHIFTILTHEKQSNMSNKLPVSQLPLKQDNRCTIFESLKRKHQKFVSNKNKLA